MRHRHRLHPSALRLHPSPGWLLICDGLAITLVSGIVLALARTERALALPARWLAPLTFVATLGVQLLSTAWWPNSGEEYGYLFLADTLLHGRLYNPPAPVPDIFNFNWIFTLDGKRFSQYPAALRRHAGRELALVAAGGAPFAACFMIYNTAITGKPLRTPFAWASPDGGSAFTPSAMPD